MRYSRFGGKFLRDCDGLLYSRGGTSFDSFWGEVRLLRSSGDSFGAGFVFLRIASDIPGTAESFRGVVDVADVFFEAGHGILLRKYGAKFLRAADGVSEVGRGF